MNVRRSAAVIAAAIVGATASGCDAAPTTVAGTAITAQSVSPGAGPSVWRDGSLKFVVLDVSRVQQVGDPATPGLSMDAKGVFILVTLSIRNTGDVAVTFLDRDQMLVDGTGATFKPDMAADIYANLGIRSTEITPGGELVVRLAFDVPLDSAPRNLLLRQSASSAGVALPLG